MCQVLFYEKGYICEERKQNLTLQTLYSLNDYMLYVMLYIICYVITYVITYVICYWKPGGQKCVLSNVCFAHCFEIVTFYLFLYFLANMNIVQGPL